MHLESDMKKTTTASPQVIKVIKYSKNLVKKEEKYCSTCLQHISPQHFQGFPNFTIHIPNPSLITIILQDLFPIHAPCSELKRKA